MHADGVFFASYIVHGNRNDQVSGSVPTAQGNGWRYAFSGLNAGVESALGGFVPSDVPQAEADALIAFYLATSGAGWSTKTNWLTDPVVDNWHGVTVTGGHVTGLALPSNNLNGTSGTTLDAITTLTSMDLSGNASLIWSGGYGVVWDASADTYVKYFVVGNKLVTTTTIDAWYVQQQMKRCVISDAGAVQYYLLPTDSTKKADGSAANIDGTDGQVMVQVPKFNYVQCQSGNGRYFFVGSSSFTITLPDTSTVASAIHPFFYKGGSASPSDYRYIGAYEGAMYDVSAGAFFTGANVVGNVYTAGDKLCSVSGQYPKTGETIVEFRAAAVSRGAGWHQYDAAANAALQILYLTEYGSFGSQAKIGNGRTGLSGGTWAAGSYIAACGLSNAIGNATGNVSAGGAGGIPTDYMSYRGVENWFGNVWKFMDGANIHNNATTRSRLFTCINYSQYASNTETNYSYAGLLAETDGYAKDIINSTGFYPSSVGGSTTTYLCDYYYTYFNDNNNSGWHIALVGGYADAGANAGAFSLNSNGGSTAAYANLGGRLCF